MELLEVVEFVTTVVTLLLMASGIPGCLNMVRTKSTKNVPFIYFLVSAMTCVFTLYYGTLVNNFVFIVVNAVGCLLWGLYIVVYIGVSQSKSWPLCQLAVLTAIMCGHVLYLRVMAPLPPALTNTLGLFVFSWTVLLLLTPLLDIMEIVRQGSSAGSDVFLLLSGVLCGLSWLYYGYLLEDVFVYGPNILGLGVNGLKLATIAAYSGSPDKVKAQ